jgi:hypothetical protein
MLSITPKVMLIFSLSDASKPSQGAGLTDEANLANHPDKPTGKRRIFFKSVRFC